MKSFSDNLRLCIVSLFLEKKSFCLSQAAGLGGDYLSLKGDFNDLNLVFSPRKNPAT